MEPIVLDRSEFVALAALMRADNIIGVDASQLLPASPAERQALYLEGEKRLIARDLARQTPDRKIQFEQSLLAMARALTQPRSAVVTIRHRPGLGQQLFLYYEREGAWVEQTLPDERAHRLAEIGATDALLVQLLDLFDFPAAGGDGESFLLDVAGFVNLARAAREGVIVDAGAAGASDPAAFDSLDEAFVTGAANGTIAMLPIRDGHPLETLEIALARGRDESWMIVADDETPGKVRAYRSDRDALAAALTTMLRSMELAT